MIQLKCCLHGCTIFWILIAVLLGLALNPLESDGWYCHQLTSDDVKQYHHLFTLSDGRTLEYFHFGDTKSNNYLLTIHGVMTEGSVSYRNNQMFKDLHLNVISPSIPGWGLSIPSPSHSILNDVNDFIQLLNALNIDTFMLSGWSAGALYSMVIASLHPNRISKLGLFVPVSMYYGKCNPFETEIESNIRYVLGVRYIRDIMSMITSSLITSSFLEDYIKPKNMKPMVWNSLKRSFCKSWDGLNRMSEYIISDWNDIDFHAVSTINKVLISSNLNDTINVPAMQQCLTRLIDGAHLIEYPNKTHHDVMHQTQELIYRFIEF